MKYGRAAGQIRFSIPKSTERDTAGEIGAAITPYLERLTGSEYLVKVTSRGTVVEVKGFAELIADLVKDNAYGALLAGVTVDNDGAKHTAQEALVTFSAKPVSPGDTLGRLHRKPSSRISAS